MVTIWYTLSNTLLLLNFVVKIVPLSAHFCRPQVRLKQLGAQEVCTIGLGDDQSEIGQLIFGCAVYTYTVGSKVRILQLSAGVHGDFDNWSSKLWCVVFLLPLMCFFPVCVTCSRMTSLLFI